MSASGEHVVGNPNKSREADKVDLREQLQNEGKVGPLKSVQLSEARIRTVRGILFDLDFRKFRIGGVIRREYESSETFYLKVLKKWIERDETLKSLQMRDSGNNIHGILMFREPVKILNDYDRERWSLIVRVVQAALPIDPGQPGITALTRPIGSVNSKTGREARLLAEGTPVSTDEVLDLFRRMNEQPFAVVGKILFGKDKVKPCPICNSDDSTLSVGPWAGTCYSCRRVALPKLYDLVLKAKSELAPPAALPSDEDSGHA